MSSQTFTIREMSEEFDVTARALRFYESKELLKPKREGQKRLYTRSCRARLKLVLLGKRFGFSLEDIRRILDLYDLKDDKTRQTAEAYRIGNERLGEMKDQRAQLEKAIEELGVLLAKCRQTLAERGALSEIEAA